MEVVIYDLCICITQEYFCVFSKHKKITLYYNKYVYKFYIFRSVVGCYLYNGYMVIITDCVISWQTRL